MSKLKDDVDRVNVKLEEMSEELISLKASIQSHAKKIATYKKELKRIRSDIDELKKCVDKGSI